MRQTQSINRYYCPLPLATGLRLDLPPDAARHVQVRRQQPGQVIELFGHTAALIDGVVAGVAGGVYRATIEVIGRSHVTVKVSNHLPEERELACAIHLAVVIPANDRMDFVVEKATELGASHIWPLHSDRSVLRLSDERAAKRQQHWQTLAANACAQSGRNRVPHIAPVMSLHDWLSQQIMLKVNQDTPIDVSEYSLMPLQCWVLSTQMDAPLLPWAIAKSIHNPSLQASSSQSGGGVGHCLLSGPEGGLTPDEEQAAIGHGFAPVSLGSAILRADTAPLAALSYLRLLAL